MTNLSLRSKFRLGLIAVAVLSLAVLISARMLGKGALFHYLEREHVVLVMTASAALDRAAEGGRSAGAVKSVDLVKTLTKARAIADQAGHELFPPEEWAFTLLGYGDVIELPRADIDDLTRILATIQQNSSDVVTPELASRLAPDMEKVIANSTKFGPLVAEAVGFVKVLTLAINLCCIGAVLWTFLMIRLSTLAPLQRAVEAAQRVAGGDLSSPSEQHNADEVGDLNRALEEMRNQLSRVVGDVRELSSAVAASMVEVSSGSNDLSTRTEHQAATLQLTAASVTQLSVSVQENGDRVRKVDAAADETRDIAVQGGEAVDRVVGRMDDILAASRRIADITGVIDGIAFQTNILALNAAVEAARAGEQGRGFAVVASEVRSLAHRSATASREIATLINDTVAKVASGAQEVDQAGKTIERVVSSVRNVSTVIAEVSASLSFQEQGIAQIDQAMRVLDENTQQNAAMAEQSASAAESVRGQSSALVGTVAQFRLANAH